MNAFLAETGIRLVHSSESTLYVAGTRWAAYAANKGRSKVSCAACGKSFEAVCPGCGMALARRFHVMADFLIGAHALTQADCLVARDLGVNRAYFDDLKVVSSA